MSDFYSDYFKDFFEKLKDSAALYASAANYLEECRSLMKKSRELIDVLIEETKAAEAACLKETTAFLEKEKKMDEKYKVYNRLAIDLYKQANVQLRNALEAIFYHRRYNTYPFGNLLVFLQRLPPKKAAETLKHIIAIVINDEAKKIMQEIGDKSLRALSYFKIMEVVVQNALFCESIKINHKLNFSTNFLDFRVASLQYQGKMAQMHSIAYERLEMYQKRRLNLLNISAFLFFLFRKIFMFPNNYISPPMRSLLKK